MSKSAISTWVGLTIGISCVVTSILMSGHLKMFLNWPSVFITLGGTLGAIVVSFPPSKLKTLMTVIKKAFTIEKYDLEKDIETIVTFAEISRREGLLALENYLDQYTDDEFLKKGILLIIDAADENQLRMTLEGATYFMQKRHQKGYSMLDTIAATAPALGLLGTYIGLIPMLNSLDDPTKLGPLMAVELVSSFYGAFVAYVIFAPLAKRLKLMNVEEVGRREILIEGLVAIGKGLNPRMIREELVSYIKALQSGQWQSKYESKKVVYDEIRSVS